MSTGPSSVVALAGWLTGRSVLLSATPGVGLVGSAWHGFGGYWARTACSGGAHPPGWGAGANGKYLADVVYRYVRHTPTTYIGQVWGRVGTRGGAVGTWVHRTQLCPVHPAPRPRNLDL